MRCYICDKSLTDKETQLMPDKSGFEPCQECLDIALEAAYSDGFIYDESLDDAELEDEYGTGSVDILDPETYRSTYEKTDLVYGYDDSYEE